MKKIMVFLMALVLGTVLLAGCSVEVGGSSFEMSAEGNLMTITAKNADTDSSVESELELEKNSRIVLDAKKLTAGKLKLTLNDKAGKEVSTTSASAGDSAAITADAGNYTVVINVLEKADGEAEVRIEE